MTDAKPETEDEKKRRLNFTANACRSGLFASSADMLADMQKAGIPNAATCLMTGAAMFTAEIVHNTVKGAQGDIPKARQWLLDSVGTYFDKYCELAVREAASEIVSGSPGIQ